MTEQLDTRSSASLRWLPPAAGLAIVLTGCLALIGWSFRVEVLKSVVPGMVTMKANTALAFVLAGAALWLQRSRSGNRTIRALARASAMAVVLIGSLTLFEYVSGWSLGIDELLFRDAPIPVATSHPGRMAVNTALCFIFSGLALLLVDVRWRIVEAHEVLAFAAGIVSLSVLVGYVYGVRSLYGLAPYTHMAVHTVGAFIVLCTGVLLLRPTRGLIGIAMSPGPGGIMARRLLPAAVAIPIVAGWLRLQGERAGYYGAEFGLSLVVVSNVIIFLFLSWWTATILSRVDATRRHTTEALSRSEEKYRRLFEDSRDAIYSTTRDGRFVDVNQAWLDLFGYRREEVTELGMSSIYLRPDERVRFQRDVESAGAVRNYPVRFRRRNGTEIDVLLTATVRHDDEGRIAGYQGIVRDVTEQKQLEEQLRQAQKMEAVGNLAGGIAHDFNNLLTVIGGRSHLLTMRLPPEDPLRREVEIIGKTAERAARLTQQLLAFSRKQVLQPRVLDLNEIVREMDRILQRLIGEHIELRTVLGADLGRVRADPGQIEQVILNLAVNARDAMPEGGRLTIETGSVELDAAYAREHVGVQPGPHVMLAVSDTGVGMDAQTQARIFEPFFTTKEAGRGTGLGLATVYGIVQQSGGHIRVYSEPGRGATFKVYLPRVDAAAEVPAPTEAPVTPLRGTETVLLVEDEDEVRALARESLEGFGYTVLEAQSPEEALRAFQTHPGPIHLLLTDVVMPKMSGRSLADRLVAARPGLKVVFMSGYTSNAIVHHGVLDEGTAFVQKPFTPGALARKVREVLSEAAGV